MSIVTTLLDELGIAASIFGSSARECHRTPRMRALLATDPEAEHVLATMRALAGELLEGPPGGTSLVARSVRRLERTCGEYHVRALSLPDGAIGLGAAVVVELESSGPPVPRLADLVLRCGLTRREAEVALLLARGGSDREIARQLALSPHTVRKHAEHIFDKLRLHSRKALMLRLSEATRATPRADEPAARPRRAPATT